MAIYAISDLHLSFGNNKPMDIFGVNWENHEEKIRKDWLRKITDNDLVLLLGDFSWAMYLHDTYQDFEYLNSLPGKKLLLKGNHDYWWESIKKMREFLKNNNFKNIDFIYNNSYIWENKIIVGTRGWSEQEENPEKIIRRENLRLEMSIKDGLQRFGEDKEIIVCMHYPPFNGYTKEELNLVKTMKKYNAKICIYGHVHGEVGKDAKQGMIDGIRFIMASSDQTNFDLIKI